MRQLCNRLISISCIGRLQTITRLKQRTDGMFWFGSWRLHIVVHLGLRSLNGEVWEIEEGARLFVVVLGLTIIASCSGVEKLTTDKLSFIGDPHPLQQSSSQISDT